MGEHHVLLKMSLPSSPAPGTGLLQRQLLGVWRCHSRSYHASSFTRSSHGVTSVALHFWTEISTFLVLKEKFTKAVDFNTEVHIENRTHKRKIKIGVQNETVWNMEK